MKTSWRPQENQGKKLSSVKASEIGFIIGILGLIVFLLYHVFMQ